MMIEMQKKTSRKLIPMAPFEDLEQVGNSADILETMEDDIGDYRKELEQLPEYRRELE